MLHPTVSHSSTLTRMVWAAAIAALAAGAGSCAPPSATAVVNAGYARRSFEMRTNMEIRSGRCSDDHQRELEEALRDVTDQFKRLTEYAGFKRVGGNILVARESGATVSLDAGPGGEYHVFAYGYSPIELSAEDEQGNTFQTPSNRAHMADVFGQAPASLQLVHAKGNYLISVKGRGCVLVATFKRTY